MFFKFLFLLGVLAVIAFVSFFGTQSCATLFPQEVIAETQDEVFKQGQIFAGERKNREAMECFYKVVNSRVEAPESHLELGILALRERMPLDAIYHFRQHLRERPNSSQANLVNAQINAAQKMYLSQLPGEPFSTDSNNATLEKKLKTVLAENEGLKRQISALRERVATLETSRAQRNSQFSQPATGSPVANKPPQTTIKVPAPTSVGVPAVPSFHTVVQGDTLSSISKKYYGTANRWRDIYNYNRNIMKSPSALKLGMKLRLPPAE